MSESNLENVVIQTGRVDPEPYMRKHPEWRLLFDKYEQRTQLSEELTIIVDFFLCLSVRSRGDENYEEEDDAYGSQPSELETETCMNPWERRTREHR